MPSLHPSTPFNKTRQVKTNTNKQKQVQASKREASKRGKETFSKTNVILMLKTRKESSGGEFESLDKVVNGRLCQECNPFPNSSIAHLDDVVDVIGVCRRESEDYSKRYG